MNPEKIAQIKERIAELEEAAKTAHPARLQHIKGEMILWQSFVDAE